MRDLSLAQVREAGRFAWRDGFLLPPLLLLFVPGDGLVSAEAVGTDFVVASIIATHHTPAEGWHHIPGCDCPYCQ